MNELIVEGLEPSDFVVLEKIIRNFKVSIEDDVSFDEIANIHNKVKQVLAYLQE